MKSRIFCTMSSVFFFFILSAATYGAPVNELFTEVTSPADLHLKKEYAQKSPAVIRSKYVEVKFDSLAGKCCAEGADTIVLNLFDDLTLTAIKDRLERRSADRYTWCGRIKGEGYSHVILVVENGGMAGSIVYERASYHIQDLGDGTHALYQIDRSALSYECHPPIIPPVEIPSTPEVLPPMTEIEGDPVIDLMLVYTPVAASATANIASEIQLAVDLTNQTYQNSEINQRLRLVHTAQVDYEASHDDSNDLVDDLSRLQDPTDGYMDEVHSLRDTYDADLVTLLVDYYSSCYGTIGIAFVMPSYMISTAFEEWGFSVVNVYCLTGAYHILAHELGHNMGAGHEYGGGAYSYSHAYTYEPGKWRTLMTGHIACDDCEDIPYFSNPEVSYEGTPTGVPEGETEPADNARTLNNTGSIVAGFRPKLITTSSTTSTVGLTTTTIVETTTIEDEPCPSEKLYGKYSEETELLRYFRDSVLSQTLEGQEIIRLYYEWSPVIVKLIEEDVGFKGKMREMIDGVLLLIKGEAG